MSETRQGRLVVWGMLSLLALLVVAVFWPGVSGSFIHDDKMSLSPLGEMGGITSLETLRQYVFSGVASSLGRPVALLTFAWDGQNWPTETRPFLITNILIHAINSLLLFALVFKLSSMLQCSRYEARMMAFVAASLWAVHPMQLATVLYVVQRMTELATLFSLLAIWCYLHGRSRLIHAPGPAYWWMGGGLIVFGGLALLSKENAALLPVLILVMEFTLLRRVARPEHWRHWAGLFLWLPTALILGLLAYKALGHAEAFASRDYSMMERLLTQSRVVIDYLIYLLLPLDVPSVYHEGSKLSTGLFTPVSTLFSVLVLGGMLVLALRMRRRQPMLSFAILWFFVGHLLESTVISLELYYLHRNYLPIIGFAIAVAYYLVQWMGRERRRFVPVALLLIVWSVTSANFSSVWGDQNRLAETWATQEADSYRAQMHHAGRLFSTGQQQEAITFLDALIERDPDFLGALAFRVVFACTLNQLTQQQFIDLVNAANVKKYDTAIGSAMHRLFDFMRSGACAQIKSRGALILLDALIQNPQMHQRKDAVSLFYNLKGSIYFHDQDLRAMDEFVKAFEFRPAYDTAFRLANLYGSLGREAEARLYATMAKQFDDQRRFLAPSRAEEVDAMLAKHFPLKN